MSNFNDELIKDIQIALDSKSLNKVGNEYDEFLKLLATATSFDFKSSVIFDSITVDVKEYISTDNSTEIMLTESTVDERTLTLGSTPLPNQFRLHKHGPVDYRTETRSASIKALAHFSCPSIDEIWNDIVECAKIAAIASVIAAILAESFEVAMASFYPSFYLALSAKIGERAKDVNVRFSTEKSHGCWSNHC